MGGSGEFALPRNLASAAEREGRHGWLRRLPQTINDLERRWGLDVGQPFQPGGQTAWVAPARRGGREDVVRQPDKNRAYRLRVRDVLESSGQGRIPKPGKRGPANRRSLCPQLLVEPS
jgi:hypothetical protein